MEGNLKGNQVCVCCVWRCLKRSLQKDKPSAGKVDSDTANDQQKRNYKYKKPVLFSEGWQSLKSSGPVSRCSSLPSEYQKDCGSRCSPIQTKTNQQANRIKPTKQHQTKPNQTKPNQTKQNQTEPNQTKQNQTKQNQTKPNQTKPNKTKPNQTKPNQTKPNKTKPNKTKPNQIDQETTENHRKRTANLWSWTSGQEKLRQAADALQPGDPLGALLGTSTRRFFCFLNKKQVVQPPKDWGLSVFIWSPCSWVKWVQWIHISSQLCRLCLVFSATYWKNVFTFWGSLPILRLKAHSSLFYLAVVWVEAVSEGEHSYLAKRRHGSPPKKKELVSWRRV